MTGRVCSYWNAWALCLVNFFPRSIGFGPAWSSFSAADPATNPAVWKNVGYCTLIRSLRRTVFQQSFASTQTEPFEAKRKTTCEGFTLKIWHPSRIRPSPVCNFCWLGGLKDGSTTSVNCMPFHAWGQRRVYTHDQCEKLRSDYTARGLLQKGWPSMRLPSPQVDSKAATRQLDSRRNPMEK